jgi:tetratricopeptide (TPR) repeat protein
MGIVFIVFCMRLPAEQSGSHRLFCLRNPSLENDSMLSRYLIKVFLVLTLVCVTGCDPETLVREKVPAPLKNALTFVDTPASGKGSKKAGAAASLRIVSPKKNAALPVDAPILFRAEAKLPDGTKPGRSAVVWQVTKRGLKPQEIGRGLTVKHKLDPGDYALKVTFVTGQKKDLVHKSKFRIVFSVSGTVTSSGQGVPGAQLVLTTLDGKKQIAKTKTGKDGAYFIEIPPGERYRLTPSKKGFSFSPLQQIFSFDGKSVHVDFVTAEAALENIRLTASADSEKPLLSICPKQEVYLKLAIKSETVADRIEASLVRPGEQDDKRLLLGEAIDAAEVPNTANPKAPKYLLVKVPANPKQDSPDTAYRLRVMVYDREGNSFAGEAPQDIRIDLGKCIRQELANALPLLEKGDIKAAIKSHELIEHYRETLPDKSSFSGEMEKNYFNRGLAHLSLALEAKKESIQQIGHLGKALVDFNEVLRFHKRDGGAYMFRGLVRQLRGNFDGAIDDYGAALQSDPSLAAAYKLRALARLETDAKGNLAHAVDDFTGALKLNADPEIRKARRKALDLDLKTEGTKDDVKVDISEIPLPTLLETVKIKEFIRK